MKRYEICFAIAPVFFIVAFSTTVRARHHFVTHKLTSVSPFAIQRYVIAHKNDEYISLEKFWRRMGIATEIWGKYDKCKASIFHLPFNNEPGDGVVLKLCEGRYGLTRFVIFKPVNFDQKTKWEFLGKIDFENQWYSVPKHQVVTADDKHWLVLSATTGHGSGYGRSHDYWYELGPKGLRQILSYPSGRFFMGWGAVPEMDSGSRILSVNDQSGVTTVTVQFFITYTADYNNDSKSRFRLWSRQQRAFFVRQSGASKFVFDPRQSELSKKEIDAIYGGEVTNSEDILRYNYAQLAQIARRKRQKSRAWLRQFLESCSETRGKIRLRRALRS